MNPPPTPLSAMPDNYDLLNRFLDHHDEMIALLFGLFIVEFFRMISRFLLLVERIGGHPVLRIAKHHPNGAHGTGLRPFFGLGFLGNLGFGL
ncbi:MAG: hypothetical protein ACKO26_07595 [Planctomycetota bacterium]